jgi:hypothetical protein
MIVDGCYNDDVNPKQGGHYMALKDDEAGNHRYDIAQNVFNGMAINCGQSHRCSVLVVLLMNLLVKPFLMEQAV